MYSLRLCLEKRFIIPDFGRPFSGLAKERKLNDAELIREIRFMVAAEYEASQLYMQLAELIDNKHAVEALKDIADEERIHAGEFLRLLHELAPDEAKFYQEGAEEVDVSGQYKCTDFRHKVHRILRNGFSMLQAIAVAGHIDDFTVMYEPVEDSRGNRRVAEKLSPFVKTLV